jgi:hypothetical protein
MLKRQSILCRCRRKPQTAAAAAAAAAAGSACVAGSVAGCRCSCWRCGGALPRRHRTPFRGPGSCCRGVTLAPAGRWSAALCTAIDCRLPSDSTGCLSGGLHTFSLQYRVSVAALWCIRCRAGQSSRSRRGGWPSSRLRPIGRQAALPAAAQAAGAAPQPPGAPRRPCGSGPPSGRKAPSQVCRHACCPPCASADAPGPLELRFCKQAQDLHHL